MFTSSMPTALSFRQKQCKVGTTPIPSFTPAPANHVAMRHVLSICLAKFCLTWKKEFSPTRYTRIGKQPTTTENSPTAKQCTELRSTLENFPNFTSNLVRQRSMYSCGEPVAHASRVGGCTLGAKLSTLIMNPREDLVPLAGVLTQLRATTRGQREGDMPRVDPGPLPVWGSESTLFKNM